MKAYSQNMSIKHSAFMSQMKEDDFCHLPKQNTAGLKISTLPTFAIKSNRIFIQYF
jgi:hypothetical protein